MSDQNPFIQEMAYEKFKLFWMLRHGHSLSEFALRLLEVNEERTLEQWEADEGFSGEVWPCFEEFLQTEYLDGSLMALLMNQEEFRQYQADLMDVPVPPAKRKLYTVSITETLQKNIEIEASSPSVAEELVRKGWMGNDYVFDADNFVDVAFNAVEE